VFRADGEDVAQTEPAEVLRFGSHGLALDLVDSEEDRLAASNQQLHQVVVGAGQFSAGVNHQDQSVGLLESDFCLGVDLRRNQLRIVGHNAARVDQAKPASGPLVLAVDAIAGDAWLVAYDGSPAMRKAVEKSRFAHIGAADNGH